MQRPALGVRSLMASTPGVACAQCPPWLARGAPPKVPCVSAFIAASFNRVSLRAPLQASHDAPLSATNAQRLFLRAQTCLLALSLLENFFSPWSLWVYGRTAVSPLLVPGQETDPCLTCR